MSETNLSPIEVCQIPSGYDNLMDGMVSDENMVAIWISDLSVNFISGGRATIYFTLEVGAPRRMWASDIERRVEWNYKKYI